MLFRFRRMRAAADFFPEGGAGLRLNAAGEGPGGAGGAPGLLAMGRADGERAGDSGRPLGAAGGGAGRAAGRRFGGADEEPESGLESGLEDGLEPGPEIVEQAQQNEDAGVEEDMATLVLDNPVLGVRPDLAGQEPNPELHGAGGAAADPNSDAAIMLRVAAGDEAGFNYLVGRYHRAMINFLYRMVHSQAVAEELAQEVFLRVYRSRESYRAEAKFTTWLYRIATNLAVNHARDTKHERAAQNVYLDVPDEETGMTPEVADDRPSVEQSLLKDERMAAIRKHVMALPERQRTAVLMHKYQGLDYRQIGEVLKLSESATKSLLFRAYQTLREKLKEFV
jgi:RNA polymerase sigma-70 factor, ECF subfamily